MRKAHFLVVLGIFLIGCADPGVNGFSINANDLKNMGLTVLELIDRGEKLEECKSMEAVFEKATQVGLDPSWIKTIDHWGNHWQWAIKKEGDFTIIRIVSPGQNTVFEDGEGDDCYVEIRYFPRQRAAAILRFVDYHQNVHIRDFARRRDEK